MHIEAVKLYIEEQEIINLTSGKKFPLVERTMTW